MSQTPETGQPARRRRGFRFSLRTLVVFVLRDWLPSCGGGAEGTVITTALLRGVGRGHVLAGYSTGVALFELHS